MFDKTVTVMGGCGHVGLPLAMCLAEAGYATKIYDIDENACQMVASGKMPFQEEKADEALPRLLKTGNLRVSSDPNTLSESQFVICVVGTPVDEYLNPTVHRFFRTIETIRAYLRDGQILILRSTLFPQTSRQVQELLDKKGPKVDVAFCPERVAQGKGFVEIKTLPQIISSFSDRGDRGARFLFEQIGVDIIPLNPLEAELAKLFNNVWRYLTFAVANQFFTIANDYGLDFYRIHDALTREYPRGQDIPRPGFAAGPCLFKDTMQLAAFSNNQFFLGHAAMLVNEGLPLYLVERLSRKYDLSQMTVGILGLAFKANCDDIRDSLAFKLRKILITRAKNVLCSDGHVDPGVLAKGTTQLAPDDLLSLDEIVKQSDLLIIGVPHAEYANLELYGKPVIDIWNSQGGGAAI